jgi:acyl carrier protein
MIELTIGKVWQDLLGIQNVGVHDNFFELGGHSLIAIQIVSRLRDALQVELSVNTLFESPTIADLAATIEKNIQSKQAEVDKITEMLGLVEQLSESEIQILLTASDESSPSAG